MVTAFEDDAGGPGEIGGRHGDVNAPLSSTGCYVRDGKPDGGWGWAVTFGAFLVFVITTGSSWAFGILYIAFLDAFDQSKAITAVPGSLIFMTMVVTIPYAGLLAEKYGHRAIMIIGAVISSIAIMASSFAPNFTMLTILYGLVGGFGYGLAHMPAIMMLSEYFDGKIGTATGLAISGTGFGTIFMSLITQYLVDRFGWRGTMLVLSAINANLCVAGAVMRPVKLRLRHMTLEEVALKKLQIKEERGVAYKELLPDDYTGNGISITANPLHEPTELEGALYRTNGSIEPDRNSNSIAQIHTKVELANGTKQNRVCGESVLNSEKVKEAERETTSKCLCGIWSLVMSSLDSVYGFELWKNPMFLSFIMGIYLNFFGMTVVSAHAAKRALEYGIHDMHSSLLVAVMGLSQAAGRFISGPLVDRCRLNPLRLYQSMAGLCGIGIIGSIFLKTFPAQVVFCSIAGYTTGACACLQTVMCVSLFGPGKMKYAYPGVILMVGAAMLTSPPIAGLCRDIQGNYLGAFYMAAAACFSSVLAHLPLSCTIKPGSKGARTAVARDENFS